MLPPDGKSELITSYYRVRSAEAARELQKVIPELVEPETWDAAGGQGVIRAVDDTLVVRQTPYVQRQVSRFTWEFTRWPDDNGECSARSRPEDAL